MPPDLLRRGIDTADGAAGYCAHCDREIPVGPDVCIGTLEGVAEACCGHGWVASPYVLFADGQRLQARDAIRWFEASGVGPPPVATVTTTLFEQYDGRLTVTSEQEYESLRLVAVRWTNETTVEPVWSFDGTTVRLTRGTGEVPLPAGRVWPVASLETMPDGG